MLPWPLTIAERLACPPNSRPWSMKLRNACSLAKTKISQFIVHPEAEAALHLRHLHEGLASSAFVDDHALACRAASKSLTPKVLNTA